MEIKIAVAKVDLLLKKKKKNYFGTLADGPEQHFILFPCNSHTHQSIQNFFH